MGDPLLLFHLYAEPSSETLGLGIILREIRLL
jgi:hypothetical protein